MPTAKGAERRGRYVKGRASFISRRPHRDIILSRLRKRRRYKACVRECSPNDNYVSYDPCVRRNWVNPSGPVRRVSANNFDATRLTIKLLSRLSCRYNEYEEVLLQAFSASRRLGVGRLGEVTALVAGRLSLVAGRNFLAIVLCVLWS